MRGVDYAKVRELVREQADKMAAGMIAQLPDEHIEHHLRQPRKMVRDKGIRFDQIEWSMVPPEERWKNPALNYVYGFFLAGEPVAVVKRQDNRLGLFLPVEGICE
jgi:hypothetical protein